MRYMGGKFRLSKKILAVVQEMRLPVHDTYIEPFLGGANSFEVIAPHFDHAIGIELNKDVALMWKAVSEGWLPPEELSREEYYRLKESEPSALRGFAAIGCSFGGKYWGGYSYKYKSGRKIATESYCAVLRARDSLIGSTIRHGSYEIAPVGPTTFVYCDPPYANTTSYSGSGRFDTERFWKIAGQWVDCGATVLVSEYSAPDNWECVKEFEHKMTLKKDVNDQKIVEKLFILQP